ncbi:hypothetical protein FPHYL_13556 [Fusarium phyllophilum]|uniref:Uncharacterized protein n=1 Tax=Fusarium phyllophilum TaxID=47803 RepID=A0A8H5IBF7_9HYPO|nr:hypothetical protein FPHYL_13556 [Fusarium phyllophilum]
MCGGEPVTKTDGFCLISMNIGIKPPTPSGRKLRGSGQLLRRHSGVKVGLKASAACEISDLRTTASITFNSAPGNALGHDEDDLGFLKTDRYGPTAFL